MTERRGAFPILTDNAVVRNEELETTHGSMGGSPGLKHQKIPSLWLQLSPGLISERKSISLVSNEIFTVLTDTGVDSWKFSVRNSGVFFLLSGSNGGIWKSNVWHSGGPPCGHSRRPMERTGTEVLSAPVRGCSQNGK